jgi:hypothetical protein
MPAEVLSPPRARTTRAVASVASTVLGLALAGCTSGSDRSPAGPSPDARATSAGETDLTGLEIPRGPFCDLVDRRAVEDALGGPVTDTVHYGNGERVEITPGYSDISHEYNCTYLGAEQASARVWLFAPPVLEPQARALVREARREPGCRFPSSVTFGTPGLTAACLVRPRTKQERPVVRVRMQGLFGTAWLTCELTLPREGPQGGRAPAVEAAREWCVPLVSTLGGGG